MGDEAFLINTVENIDFVVDVYAHLVEHYKSLVLKYTRASAHQITVVEDLGSTSSSSRD